MRSADDTWFLTVPSLRYSDAAISWLDAPVATSRATSSSRADSDSEGDPAGGVCVPSRPTTRPVIWLSMTVPPWAATRIAATRVSGDASLIPTPAARPLAGERYGDRRGRSCTV